MDKKSRLSINKSLKSHIDYRYKDWLDAEKTKKFKNLVEIMASDLGGLVKAYLKIGLSHTTQDNLLKNRISVDTAKIILSAFKKHKLEKEFNHDTSTKETCR